MTDLPPRPSLPEGEPVHVPVPPPPPRIDPRPTPPQQRVLLGLASTGAILCTAGYLVDLDAARSLQRAGLFLLCYAGVVGSSWLPTGVLSRRVDAMLDRWVKQGASGYYGVMALATYVHLEMRTMAEAVMGFEFDQGLLRDVVIQWVTGFSLESVMNFAKAMAWPATLWGKQATGLAPLLLVAGTWGAYELGRRYLPQRVEKQRLDSPGAVPTQDRHRS